MRVLLLGVAIAGLVVRCAALPTPDWSASEWLSVPEAAVLSPDCRDLKRGVHRAADGTSWFSGRVVNTQEVHSARWSARESIISSVVCRTRIRWGPGGVMSGLECWIVLSRRP